MEETLEKHILVVDDEELLRSSLVKFLERNGFIVQSASSGNKAFDLVKTHHFDLVISDVRMPDGSGPDLLDDIKNLGDKAPGVMFISGFRGAILKELEGNGAICVFNKPADRSEILQKVKDYFQMS